MQKETDQLGQIAAQYDGQFGINIEVLEPDYFKVKVGSLYIDVITAKTPGGNWDTDHFDRVIRARRSFDHFWGPVPLTDKLDDVSYVDVGFIYDDRAKRGNWDAANEGLTMRTVNWDRKSMILPDLKPDDLRFFVGPGGKPYINILADQLFNGDLFKAMEKVVAASRLAPVRNKETKDQGHNRFTPDVFAAIQIMSALRAAQENRSYYINTMKPSMREDVLMLDPTSVTGEGIAYEHVLAETGLNMRPGSLKLNRNPKSPDGQYTLKHLKSYLGYFLDQDNLNVFFERFLGDVYNNTSSINPNMEPAPQSLQPILQLLSPRYLGHLRPSQFRSFAYLFDIKGRIYGDLTGEKLVAGLTNESMVGDSARPYLQTVVSRFEQGFRVLSHSARAHDPEFQSMLRKQRTELKDREQVEKDRIWEAAIFEYAKKRNLI